MHGARYLRSHCIHNRPCPKCEYHTEIDPETFDCAAAPYGTEILNRFSIPCKWTDADCEEINKLKGYVPQDNTPAPEVPREPYVDSVLAWEWEERYYDGYRTRFRFANGMGADVIITSTTKGGRQGLYTVRPFMYERRGSEYSHDYDINLPVTKRLTPPMVHEQLEKIRTSEDPRYAYDPQSGRWERIA